MSKNDNNCNSDSERSEVSVFVPFQKEQVSDVGGEFNYLPDNPHYPFLWPRPKKISDMTKAERRYYINRSVFRIKKIKETMDCNNDENDISLADESEFSQSKVSSDISQSFKNISDEMTFGQNFNDESSLHSIDRKRCRDYDDSNYIIAKN